MRPTIETALARSPTNDTGIRQSNIFAGKQRLVQRFNALMKQRNPWETVWKIIRDYELPYDGMFDDDIAGRPNMHDDEIYTGIVQESRDTFAAGVQSGLTPPSRKWFRLGMANSDLADDTGIRRFLDQRNEIMEAVLARSNFYNAVHQCYSELPFGQAPMGIFSSAGGITFVPYTIGTYALACNASGIVNVFARKVKMTVAQIVQQFGLDNCPDTVRHTYQSQNGYDTNETVCWMVEPNDENMPDELGNKKMPYRSVYWIEGSSGDECLAVTGFEEWPVPVARYRVKGTEAYAIGPAWNALPDSRMIQMMELDSGTATELGVKPPLQAPSNIYQSINLFPGGVTPVDNQNMVIQPIFHGQLAISELDQKIIRIEDRIKRAYSSDLFMMLDQLERGNMTAQEVMARNQEKLQQLGPVVERMQYEFLTAIIERVYNILDRSGVFPPIPNEIVQEVIGQEIKIEYISPLAQAQKMSGLTAIEQGLAFVGQAAQFDPSVLDKVNMVDAVEKYLDRVGVPATMIRSSDEYQQIQEQRQKAMQAQQQQEAVNQALQQAAPLAQAAKNMTEAANDGNPALREWMGTET